MNKDLTLEIENIPAEIWEDIWKEMKTCQFRITSLASMYSQSKNGKKETEDLEIRLSIIPPKSLKPNSQP